MNWRNLMDTAKELAGQRELVRPGRPRQENLRKAVSASYYAMFHALCRSNADTMTGRQSSTVSRRAWTRSYRALDHRQAKNRLLQARQDLPAAAPTIRHHIHAASESARGRRLRSSLQTLKGRGGDPAQHGGERHTRVPAIARRPAPGDGNLVLLQERSSP